MSNTNRTLEPKTRKNNIVFTPPKLANFIAEIIEEKKYKTILDPAIGAGHLIEPYKKDKYILGGDKYDIGGGADEFILNDIDDQEFNFSVEPDLIIMNPPFNGASGRRLFPEVFLKKIFDRYGYDKPVIMITGDNFLNNTRLSSKRRSWIKEKEIKITSIITLPLDVFEGVQFNTQVLFFNIGGIKPHYMY